MTIRSVQDAKREIRDDAATRAYTYLEREAPRTLSGLTYLVNNGSFGVDAIMELFNATYGVTEEKTIHKIRLVAEALVRERDDDDSN